MRTYDQIWSETKDSCAHDNLPAYTYTYSRTAQSSVNHHPPTILQPTPLSLFTYSTLITHLRAILTKHEIKTDPKARKYIKRDTNPSSRVRVRTRIIKSIYYVNTRIFRFQEILRSNISGYLPKVDIQDSYFVRILRINSFAINPSVEPKYTRITIFLLRKKM